MVYYLTIKQIKEFQEILRPILLFYERSGRVDKYSEGDKVAFFARKAVAYADPKWVSIEIERKLEGQYLFIYLVSASIETPGKTAKIQTIFVHDDGIMEQRQNVIDDPENVVHSLKCLTDILEGTNGKN